MTDLKPCPFCGHKCAFIQSRDIADNAVAHAIVCSYCGAWGPLAVCVADLCGAGLAEVTRRAESDWNKRGP